MGRTTYEKIWDAHVVETRDDGTALIYIDRHLVHEVTSPQAFEALKAAAVACVIGIGMIFTVGFAPMESVHDAAHDSRHALSFPCH